MHCGTRNYEITLLTGKCIGSRNFCGNDTSHFMASGKLLVCSEPTQNIKNLDTLANSFLWSKVHQDKEHNHLFKEFGMQKDFGEI